MNWQLTLHYETKVSFVSTYFSYFIPPQRCVTEFLKKKKKTLDKSIKISYQARKSHKKEMRNFRSLKRFALSRKWQKKVFRNVRMKVFAYIFQSSFDIQSRQQHTFMEMIFIQHSIKIQLESYFRNNFLA